MKINLNSPDGNIFVLLSKIHDLMVKANLSEQEIRDWEKGIFTYNSYKDLVEAIKVKCVKLSELLNEEIEIIKTEEYEMEV